MLYFKDKLSQGFVALYSGRMIQFAASGLINLFLPVYLFIHLNQKVELVFIYYILGHLFYALLLPVGAQYLNIIGLNNSLRLSVFFYASYFVVMHFLPYSIFWLLPLALVVLTLSRLGFWLPYHVDIAQYTRKGDRGKQISLLWGTRMVLMVVMPAISGFLIKFFDFGAVFAIATVLYLSAIIPYFALPKSQEKYVWGVRETFRRLFAPKNRRLVLANMANGAENVVSIVIWPIFIWQLLNGSFVKVGILSSLIVLVAVILQFLVGKYTDILNKRKILHFGSLLYALGWLAKAFVLTAYQIFFVGTFHNFAQIFKDTPFDALNYEILADAGHYVDEYTVLKEIAVQAGKVLILLLALLISWQVGLNWTFVLAALASLFINIL
ncbi:MFS transporter [Candidatus Parcubacteria bacterium]|nr:MAG: MFS transporter [Candidatus Parcubacteria bacterium]